MEVSYANALMPGAMWIQVQDVVSGEPVPLVIEANVDEGWIVQPKRTRSGRLVIEGGQIIYERREQRVTLSLRDDAPEVFRRAFIYSDAMLR